MNTLKSATLALAVSLMSAYVGLTTPAMAQTTTPTTTSEASLNTQITGQVESIDGDLVTVRTNDGVVRTYEFESGLVQTLRLATGSTVIIDTLGVRVGTIRRLSPYVAAIELADGDVDTFYIPEETRRTLFPGDTVAIRPCGSFTRLTGNQMLTARNVRTIQAVVPSAPVQQSVQQTQVEIQREVVQPAPQVAPTVPAPAPQPVPALW